MDFALPMNTKHANCNICMNSKVLAKFTTSFAFECFHPLCWLIYHHCTHSITSGWERQCQSSFHTTRIFFKSNNKILEKCTPPPPIRHLWPQKLCISYYLAKTKTSHCNATQTICVPSQRWHHFLWQILLNFRSRQKSTLGRLGSF